ncbi:MAG: hypothetical protein WBV39_00415 [Rudaea sp.]
MRQGGFTAARLDKLGADELKAPDAWLRASLCRRGDTKRHADRPTDVLPEGFQNAMQSKAAWTTSRVAGAAEPG